MPSRRIPSSLDLTEIQAAIRDLHQRMDQWDRPGVVDLRGRRIVNAGKERSPRDYILKDDFTRALAALEQRIRRAQRAGTSTTPSDTPPTTPPTNYPPPNHPMELMYYVPDRPSYGDPTYDDWYDEVKSYTNAYLCTLGFGYADSNTPVSDWREVMRQRLDRAHGDGKSLMLQVNLRSPWAEFQLGGDGPAMNFMLDVAGPYWDKVTRVDLVDEQITDPDELSNLADKMRNKIASRQLALKPIGATFTRDTWNEAAIFVSNLDFFGCEAYLDAPGPPTPQEAAQVLTNQLQGALALAPPDKDIVIVIQGYSRNLSWTNLDTLKAIQGVPYLVSYQDPRVVALTIFSYGRESGTRYTDTVQGGKLADEHKGVGAAIIGNPVAGLSEYKAPWGGIFTRQVEEAVNRAKNVRAAASFTALGRLIAGSEPTYRNAVTDLLESDFKVRARSSPTSTYLIQVKPAGADAFQESYQIWAPSAAGGKIVVGSASYMGTKVPAEYW